jgi:simple sugar transport system ATP-binding protein
LFVRDERKNLVLHGMSFQVRGGEVLGIAGVQGNGQTELVYALTGLLPIESGQVKLLGRTFRKLVPRQVLESGVAHVPEDRLKHGLVLSFPIYDNLVLCNYYLPPYARGVSLQQEVIVRNGEKLIKQYDVRTPSASMNASTLSGGNQQKVIIAREFSRPIQLLIASQPTRGLDVGSIEYIHNRIIEKREQGVAVLLVSSELDEILALSDRIAVVYRGQIMETLEAEKTDKEALGLLMAGMRPRETRQRTGKVSKKAKVERVF